MSRNKKYKMMPISSNFTEKSGYRAQFVGDGYSIDARKEILPAVIRSTGVQIGHVRQGAAFRINGKHLTLVEGDKVTASAKNAEGETIEAECTVLDSADDHIDATLAAAFNDKAFANREIVFKVEGRCGDPLAGTQTKTIAATLDDNGIPAPVVTKYINQGMEADVTEANEIFAVGGDAIFTGSNLAGAAVRAVSINGDTSVDIDAEHVTASDSELRISHNAHGALFGTFGNDVDIHVEIMTPGGTARVKCKLVNDTVAG